jgi:hypothetical protein
VFAEARPIKANAAHNKHPTRKTLATTTHNTTKQPSHPNKTPPTQTTLTQFIDKYTQVPRILNPVVQVLDELPNLAKDPAIAGYLSAAFGGVDGARRAILVDFCRHAFGARAARFFCGAFCCGVLRCVLHHLPLQKLQSQTTHPPPPPPQTQLQKTDGSGADNFFDAGSCIDGRLTSAWNWCSQIEKKPYYPVFRLAGFTGFDGEWK